ncbi:MAG: hypothetical protein JWO91_3902 [Acidobacteriaceae bacterium]|jgi:hypothetical protein|nr:hypothetical protein [Acidobacteriaceae bacterium]
MTHEFTPRIQELCALIAQEKDPRKFTQLVEELNRLLAEKDQKPQKPVAVVKASSVA